MKFLNQLVDSSLKSGSTGEHGKIGTPGRNLLAMGDGPCLKGFKVCGASTIGRAPRKACEKHQ